jgi:hypothetical protein
LSCAELLVTVADREKAAQLEQRLDAEHKSIAKHPQQLPSEQLAAHPSFLQLHDYCSKLEW